MSIKEKILIGVIASTIVLAVGSSVWALVRPDSNSINNKSSPSTESISTDISDEQDSGKKVDDHEISEDTSSTSKPDIDTTVAPSVSPSSNRTEYQTATPKPTAPASTTAAPQPQRVSCNESMKASYTNLYNSQVSAENANWGNRVNQWGDEASARGMAFSGYVQDKINQNKPAHDASLASINNNYQSNLASINCL